MTVRTMTMTMVMMSVTMMMMTMTKSVTKEVVLLTSKLFLSCIQYVYTCLIGVRMFEWQNGWVVYRSNWV